MKLFDLTHVFDDAMPVYPGDPVPELTQKAHLETDGFNDFCLTSGMHVGTHMDAPLHMIADGAFMSDIPAAKFVGRGRLVDARGRDRITADLLDGVELQPGDIVLVMTGRSEIFRDPGYYIDFPVVDDAFAHRLVESGVSLLGMDTPSPDGGPPYSVHKILLSAGILIVENLTDLHQLIDIPRFEITALPARYRWEAAPCRVIARECS